MHLPYEILFFLSFLLPAVQTLKKLYSYPISGGKWCYSHPRIFETFVNLSKSEDDSYGGHDDDGDREEEADSKQEHIVTKISHFLPQQSQLSA